MSLLLLTEPQNPFGFLYFYLVELVRYFCFRFYLFLITLVKRSRKEVFQPHLPVRLPCYDLAPVTGLTLNSSYKGHHLQVLPTSMA